MDYLIKNYLGYLNTTPLNEQQLMEYVNNYLTESSVSKESIMQSYNKNLKATEIFLKKYKVNLSYIKSEAQKAAKFVNSQREKGIKPDITAKHLVNTIGKKFISKVIDPAKNEMGVGEKVLKSIIVFSILLFVVSFIGGIGDSLFSPIAATFFGACIIAPLFEEYAKRFALLGNYPYIYTGIFAGLEAMIYIIGMTAAGTPLATALIARGIAFVFHFSTTMVQKHYHDQAVKDDNETTSNMGYWVAVCMHFSWNLMAIASEVLS